MDLREIRDNTARHPWEISRAHALRAILAGSVPLDRTTTILDVGCGDCYAVSALFDGTPVKSIDAVDVNLTDEQMKRAQDLPIRITVHTGFDGLPQSSFTLILLLDVIEHLDNDERFLKKMVNTYAKAEGYSLITVPAFSALFSSHDRFLKHYRRYDRTQFVDLLDRTGLTLISHGYLFGSLLPIRFLGVIIGRLLAPGRGVPKGIGGWKHSRFVTNLIVSFFDLENRLLIALSKCGIRIPGLSLWALCKKRQS